MAFAPAAAITPDAHEAAQFSSPVEAQKHGDRWLDCQPWTVTEWRAGVEKAGNSLQNFRLQGVGDGWCWPDAARYPAALRDPCWPMRVP